METLIPLGLIGSLCALFFVVMAAGMGSMCPACQRTGVHPTHQTWRGRPDPRFPDNPMRCAACGWSDKA